MFDLGKYAFPVFISYALTLILLGGLILMSLTRQRRIKAQIRALEAERK